MAGSANAENVGAAIRPPNYRAAAKEIQGIEAIKSTIGEKNKKIGERWNAVEGYGVHRAAAKTFARISKMEPPERADFLRSFNGLADVADWPEKTQDLADQAEGKVVPMRLKGGEEPNSGQGAGETAGDGAETGADGAGPAKNMQEALERSRQRLGGGGAPGATDE